MSWLGRATTTFHSSSDPLRLPLKSSIISSNDETSTTKLEQKRNIDLLTLCKSVTPPCNLNPFLFNGHLQTIWTTFKGQDVPIYYKRQVFSADDPAYAGTFAVDFVISPNEGSDDTLPPRTTYYSDEQWASIGSEDTKPMLVVLHGLSGGSHEIYLRHVLAPLVAEGESQWEACVVNSRGCAKSKITSPVLYNARATWDVRQVVKWLRKTFPNRPLFGIGFSLGANILTNYLGEEGDACQLKAAVVCSNPWQLDVGSLSLQRSRLGLEGYSRTMGTNMKRLFETHVDEIAKNPRVDIERVRGVKYLHEFDRELQGPTWGYPTEGAYYRDASSTDSLLAVRIPLFAIHAEDDPIAVREALPYQEVQHTPYVVLCTTSLGGHLSWFEMGGDRWFAKPAVGFLQKMASELELSERLRYEKFEDRSTVSGTNGVQPNFDPMRRKLKMHVAA